jgi:2-(3-amino-3-carboxypropyl)histidine synthase
MPRLLLLDAKYENPIELTSKLETYLKKHKIKSVAIFASTQFTNLNNLISQLKKLKIKPLITKAKRTSDKIQILGCDCYNDSFQQNTIEKADLILYIGDGLFHPKALLLAQKNNKKTKQVLMFNPIADKLTLINNKIINDQLKKAKRNLKFFLNAETIGILVTIKPGQQFLNQAIKLKEHLEKQNKKAYIFIDNTLDINQLENYPFIQAWVNTACPRIGTDDITNIKEPMINIREASNPIKALEALENDSKSKKH